MAAGEGGILGGSIAIDQRTARASVENGLDMGQREDIAASQNLRDGGQSLQLMLDHLMEQTSGKPENTDLVPLDDSS